MNRFFSKTDAENLDREDKLGGFREKFHIPQHQGEDCMYFTGNSLGLQPKGAEKAITQELEDWKNLGVEGHFEAKNPWMPYHERFSQSLSRLVGAQPNEVVAMGSLTGNLHNLLASFFIPTEERPLLLCEAKAFPSDRYALLGQLKWHGLNEDHLLEIDGDGPEGNPTTQNILDAIETHGDRVATLMIGGVNYFTGQVFDMKAITQAAQAKGILVGFDLAHGIGNVPLQLHDWGVDFAAWCSYKYLNSGPGSVAGIYVHERHHGTDRPILAGWWGHDKATRFQMPAGFIPMQSAEAWQTSNAPILTMAAHRAALDLFDQADLSELRQKSLHQASIIMGIMDNLAAGGESLTVLTPREDARRGGQVSVTFHNRGREFFDQLIQAGVIADWREPGTIRFASAPLYNSYLDLARLEATLHNALTS